ncbi:MAG: hypothetical protein OIF57_11480 [Marinobacterium sp.]|nr:hypothetical protein [Marinobacterium sp.]
MNNNLPSSAPKNNLPAEEESSSVDTSTSITVPAETDTVVPPVSDAVTPGQDSQLTDPAAPGTEASQETAEDADTPASDMAEPAGEADTPASDTAEPAGETGTPASDTAEPAGDAETPASDTDTPVEETTDETDAVVTEDAAQQDNVVVSDEAEQGDELSVSQDSDIDWENSYTPPDPADAGGSQQHIGTDGDDTLNAWNDYYGHFEFDGKAGDDEIICMFGDDKSHSIHFGYGYDNDTVRYSSKGDTIIMGPGITAADLQLEAGAFGNTVISLLRDGVLTGDTLTLVEVNLNDDAGHRVVFEDGTALTVRQLMIGTNPEWLQHTGTEGADTLVGDLTKRNEFNGGAGDDTFKGTINADRYIFNRGDGNDSIDDVWSVNGDVDGLTDTIVFGEGISLSDIRITQASKRSPDLTIHVLENGEESGDSIFITSVAKLSNPERQTLEFADGTKVVLQDIPVTVQGTDNTEALYGYVDRFNGFHGGQGDDTLYTDGSKANIYFGYGDGKDVVDKMTADSAIVMADGISLEDIRCSWKTDGSLRGPLLELFRDGEATGDSVLLYALKEDTLTSQSVVFSDGSKITVSDLLDLKLNHEVGLVGTAGDDKLEGQAGTGQIFKGGAGNDVLLGKELADTYVFNRGDGHDVILDNGTGAAAGTIDIIQFGEGISRDDLRLIPSDHHSTSVELQILQNGEPSGDSLSLRYGLQNNLAIEQLRFNDDSVMSFAELLLEVRGTDADDTLTGVYSHQNLMVGGAGNDTFELVAGAAQIQLGYGSDHDTVTNMGADDVIRLDEGVTASDVRVFAASTGVVVELLQGSAPSGDSLTLAGMSVDALDGQTLRFADGAEATLAAHMAAAGDNETYVGTTGHDVLEAEAGEDAEFHGGKGDDDLLGKDGADRYVFNRGDGHDSILDNGTGAAAGTVDTIVLGVGISRDDLRLVASDHHSTSVELQVLQNGEPGTDRLTLKYGLQNALSIEQLQFSDGTTMSFDELRLEVRGTAGDDTLEGVYGHKNLMVGGAGDDTLKLAVGANEVQLTYGGGNDTVINSRFGDDVVLGDGITEQDLRLFTSGAGVVIELLQAGRPSGDSITLSGNNLASLGDQKLIFADGTELLVKERLQADLAQPVLQGTDGNDELKAQSGQDTEFRGGTGDDTLLGKNGADRYVFNRGDGHDSIIDNGTGSAAGTLDTIVLGEGISREDLRLVASDHHSTSAELQILQDGEPTADRLTLKYGLQNALAIEQLEFSDGSTLSMDELLLEVHGTDAAETLTGVYGHQNLVISGGGDDRIELALGANLVQFGYGSGKDTVINSRFSDDVKLDADITSQDLQLFVNASGVVIELLRDGVATGDRLTLADNRLESLGDQKLIFADGTEITVRDRLQDNSGYAIYEGTDGNDLLRAAARENAEFRGGAGDDDLLGNSGADRYVFNRGDGHDRILDNGTAAATGTVDTLILGEGIERSDLRLVGSSHHSTSVELQVLENGQPGSDRLTIKYGLQNNLAIEQLQFSDGSTMRFDDLPLEIHGTDGDDTLTGVYGHTNLMVGGAGNDTFELVYGEHDVQLGYGSGQDTVHNSYTGDDIRLDEGITAADVKVSVDYTGVVIELLQAGQPSGDSLTLSGVVLATLGNQKLLFADGTESTVKAQLLQSAGRQVFEGTSGDDLLESDAGYNAEFRGGEGNDTLVGQEGSDHYIFNRGDGHDQILDVGIGAEAGTVDSIIFGAGISAGDLRLVPSDQHSTSVELQILQDGQLTGDRLTLKYGLQSNMAIEQLQFSDGSTMNFADLPLEIHGTSGNDTLSGVFGQKNLMVGGAGDDVLELALGDNDVQFGYGSGNDTVRNSHMGDDIVLDEGISTADLRFAETDAGIVITLLQDGTASGDSVTLVGATQATLGDQALRFADGTEVSVHDALLAGPPIEWTVQQGTDGADLLTGVADAHNEFRGGLGDDTLTGSNMADRYIYNRGDGADTLTAFSTDGSESDRIVFGEGISFEDLQLFQRSEYDETWDYYRTFLQLNVLNKGEYTGDQLALKGTTRPGDGGLEVLEFADGSTVNLQDMYLKVGDLKYHEWGRPSSTGNAIGYNYEFDTGAGDDIIHLVDGHHKVHFGYGHDQDFLEKLKSDQMVTIIIDEGIALEDIKPYYSVGFGTISLKLMQGGELTGDNLQFSQAHGADDWTVQLGDGTELTVRELFERYDQQTEAISKTGTDGEDRLDVGNGVAGIFEGGKGDDFLTAEWRSDTYIFNRGDGHDSILDVDLGNIAGAQDVISFGDGITQADIRVVVSSKSENDYDIHVLDNGQQVNDTLTVLSGLFRKDDSKIEQLQFSDGTTIDMLDLIGQGLPTEIV